MAEALAGWRLEGGAAWAGGAGWAPDIDLVAARGGAECGGGGVAVHRLGRGAVWARAGRGDGEVVCAAWRPDGGALACGLRGGGVATFDGRTGRPVADLEARAGAAPVAGLSWTGPGPAPRGGPAGASAPAKGPAGAARSRRAHTLCSCSRGGEVSLSVDGARVAAFGLQGFLPPGSPGVRDVPRIELVGDAWWGVRAVCALAGGGHRLLEVRSARLAEFMGSDLPYFACLSSTEAAAAGAQDMAASLQASCEAFFASRPAALAEAEKPFRSLLQIAEKLSRAVLGLEHLALDLRGASFECRSGGLGDRSCAAAGIATAVADLGKAAARAQASVFAIDLRARQGGAALFCSEYQPLDFEHSPGHGDARAAAAAAASAGVEACLERIRELEALLGRVQGACVEERTALTSELSKSFEAVRVQELLPGPEELRCGGGEGGSAGPAFFFAGDDGVALAVGVLASDARRLEVRVHRSGTAAAEGHEVTFPPGTEVVDCLQYSPDLLLAVVRGAGPGAQPLRLHPIAPPREPGEDLGAGEGLDLEPCAPVTSLAASRARGLLGVCSSSGQVAVYDIGGLSEA